MQSSELNLFSFKIFTVLFKFFDRQLSVNSETLKFSVKFTSFSISSCLILSLSLEKIKILFNSFCKLPLSPLLFSTIIFIVSLEMIFFSFLKKLLAIVNKVLLSSG